MSVWKQIKALAEGARRLTLDALFDALAERRARRDETAFSVALIALSAKLAKADGVVTDDEIAAFRDFFQFDDADADAVRMLYNLAQQDVAGFDHYLTQVRRLFGDAPAVLEDVLDCLFHVAAADGVAHPREIEMLERAANAFGISGAAFRRIRAVHVGADKDDPYVIIGVEPGAGADVVRRAYLALAKEHHPDALRARGVPDALLKIAEARIAAINAAYERIVAEGRAPAPG